jgi:hypothetical protein
MIPMGDPISRSGNRYNESWPKRFTAEERERGEEIGNNGEPIRNEINEDDPRILR